MTQEALKLALEALDRTDSECGSKAWEREMEAITAIKEALTLPDPYKQGYADAMNWKVQNHLEHLPTAQPEQEPVATVESVATVVSESGNQEVTMSWWHEPALPVGTKLYTTPPQRKPLTSMEIRAIEVEVAMSNSFAHPTKAEEFARAIEAAHGIRD